MAAMDGLPCWFRDVLREHASYVFSAEYMAICSQKRFLDVFEIYSGKKNLSLACQAATGLEHALVSMFM